MYIIAEIGINHNGNLDLALEMIKAAHEAGANCVKFQKRNPDKCVPEDQKNIPRIFKGKEMTYLEYKKQIEFSEYEYDKINEYCHSLGIDWSVSVWDVDSVHFIKKYKYDIPFIKIPSACITNIDLLKEVDKLQIPVIISGGMSTLEEIITATSYLSNLYGLLHCNSSYPSNEAEIDLDVIFTYQLLFNNICIGYSGHEIGYLPTLLSTAMHADIIERHFTLDNEMEGTDQKASLNPIDFANMVKEIDRIKIIMGNNLPTVYESEQSVKQKLRLG